MKNLPPLTPADMQMAREQLMGGLIVRGILQQSAQGRDPQVDNVYAGIIGQPAQHDEFISKMRGLRDAPGQERQDAAYRAAVHYFFGYGMYDRKGVSWDSASHLYAIARQCADLAEAFMRLSSGKVSPAGQLVITEVYA